MAEDVLNEAAFLASQHQDTLFLARVKVFKANTRLLSLNYLEALQMALDAKAAFQKIDTTTLVPKRQKNILITWLSLINVELTAKVGLQFPPAQILALNEEVIGLSQSLYGENSVAEGVTYSNLANYFKAREDFQRSRENSMKAISILEKYPPGGELLNAWLNLSDFYTLQDSFSKASICLDSVRKHVSIKKVTQHSLLFMLGKKIIDIYLGKDLESIKDSLLWIQERSKELDNFLIYNSAEIGLGELERKRRNYAKAIFHLNQVHKAGEGRQDIELNYKVHQEKLKTYEEAGWYKEAFEEQKQLNLLLDSLNTITNQAIVLDLETKYKLKEEQAKSEKLTLLNEVTEQNKQRWQAIAAGSGVAGLSLLLLASIFYYSRQRAQRDRNQIQTLHNELDHRVKNNLAFLDSMVGIQAKTQKDPEVKTIMDATRSRINALVLLHNMLGQYGGDESIKVEEYFPTLITQLKRIADYSGLDVKINSHFQPLNLHPREIFPLALILNEWLTNAFKYAVPGNSDPEINIELRGIGNDQVILFVSDNGPGYDPNNHRSGSYGARLVRTQVKQLRGHLDTKTNDGLGTRYTLTFKSRNTL